MAGVARQDRARLGEARSGTVWPGKARPGVVWQGRQGLRRPTPHWVGLFALTAPQPGEMVGLLGVPSQQETMFMTREESAEIVTRRFRIERGSEGEVERIYVEGADGKGRRHWFPVWTGKQAGRPQDLRWLDVSQLLSIDLVVPPQARLVSPPASTLEARHD
jgi:hypothetical protein